MPLCFRVLKDLCPMSLSQRGRRASSTLFRIVPSNVGQSSDSDRIGSSAHIGVRMRRFLRIRFAYRMCSLLRLAGQTSLPRHSFISYASPETFGRHSASSKRRPKRSNYCQPAKVARKRTSLFHLVEEDDRRRAADKLPVYK